MQYSFSFPSGTVSYYFSEKISKLLSLADPASTILLTDSNVAQILPESFSAYRRLVIPAGEESKSLPRIGTLAAGLMELEAHRGTLLLGVGGGVVTDITGLLAAVYMRGIDFAFVPTTLLGMVDAAIGGKNGVNHEGSKNMLGTFRQPQFVWYDESFLQRLPDAEWSNGFAEILKYACIADARILTTLQEGDVSWFRQHPVQMAAVVQACADVKNKIVHADEEESGMRQILNFGHTAGHAFEALYGLPHGVAVGLGMRVACILSVRHAGLDPTFPERLAALLEQMGLPVSLDFDVDAVIHSIRLDKKRTADAVNFVLLQGPGVAVVRELSFAEVTEGLRTFQDECSH